MTLVILWSSPMAQWLILKERLGTSKHTGVWVFSSHGPLILPEQPIVVIGEFCVVSYLSGGGKGRDMASTLFCMQVGMHGCTQGILAPFFCICSLHGWSPHLCLTNSYSTPINWHKWRRLLSVRLFVGTESGFFCHISQEAVYHNANKCSFPFPPPKLCYSKSSKYLF